MIAATVAVSLHFTRAGLVFVLGKRSTTECVSDGSILGHHVPRGTVVLCLLSGPSIWSPAFTVDPKQRYVPGGERDAKIGGRADKAWDPRDMSDFQPERWLVRGEKGDDDYLHSTSRTWKTEV